MYANSVAFRFVFYNCFLKLFFTCLFCNFQLSVSHFYFLTNSLLYPLALIIIGVKRLSERISFGRKIREKMIMCPSKLKIFVFFYYWCFVGIPTPFFVDFFCGLFICSMVRLPPFFHSILFLNLISIIPFLSQISEKIFFLKFS